MYQIETRNPNALCRIGEEAVFHIIPVDSGADDEAWFALSWDGWTIIQEGRIRPQNGPMDITHRPDKPGFLKLRITAMPSQDGAPPAVLAQAAIAVEPESIAPSLPVPDDFDTFWSEKLAPQLATPLQADVIPHPSDDPCRIDAVRIGMPNGESIYGWLMRPHSPGPYPALVLYHGAGVYSVSPEHGQERVARGFMVLSINPQPIPNDQPREYYVALREGALADYRTRGRESRDSLYFVPMFLRATRAIDFLLALPDWDGRNILLSGHSQGGGQALAAAALHPRVTAISVSCPTHCDHTGPVAGRIPGWPRIVEMHEGQPDPRHVEAARYIDGVNFASRIKCPALFGVCFLDDLCPPTGVYAAYNALSGPKTIHHDPLTGHIHTDTFREIALQWAMKQVSPD